MNQDQLIALLPDVLGTHWNLPAVSVAALGGGMNSTTALVTADHRRCRLGASRHHNRRRRIPNVATSDLGNRARRPQP